jgi:lipoate-protein ligase A
MIWALERATGSAATFHSRPLPEPSARAVWAFTVDRPAIVLGSTQPATTIDAAAAAARGIDVVRRHSGGGAVLLVPGESLWVDVIVPAGDPVWDDDVGRAAWWVGDAWARALTAAGLPGATVHRGPLVRSPWSATVCFAGLGPGEVTAGGRKVVGISQRRTRAGARFQCSVHHRWDPATLIALLAPPRPSLAELDEMVAEVAAADDILLAAFLAALPAG